MVPGDLRAPTRDQVGILCPCSTSLSASLKGLERYVASGVVCRCYHMGVRSVLQLVCIRLLPVSACVCSLDGTQQCDVCVAGIHSSVCIECYSALDQQQEAVWSTTFDDVRRLREHQQEIKHDIGVSPLTKEMILTKIHILNFSLHVYYQSIPMWVHFMLLASGVGGCCSDWGGCLY